MIYKLSLFLFLLVHISITLATPLHIDYKTSYINFSITHLVFLTAKGGFSSYSGNIYWDPLHLSKSSFSGYINVKSISAHIDSYNDELLSEPFFNEKKFPKMTLKSTHISKVSTHNYMVNVDLTCKGITIPFQETLTVMKNPSTNMLEFSTHFSINRFDFGIGTHLVWPILDHNVHVDLLFVTNPKFNK